MCCACAAGCAHLSAALCRLLVAAASARGAFDGWVPTLATFHAVWAVCGQLPHQLEAASDGDGAAVWALLDSASQQPAAELFAACLLVLAAAVVTDTGVGGFPDDAQHPVCRCAAVVPALFASASAGQPAAAVLRRRHVCLFNAVYGLGRLVPGRELLTGTPLGKPCCGQLLARQRLPACTTRCLQPPQPPHSRC